MPHLKTRFDEYYKALADMGIAEAVAVLNRNVPHRYSAVYRLQGSVLHNLVLVDKLNEVRPEFLAEVPLHTSFCQFVLRDGFFVTQNSGDDRRLDGHPYQGQMVSYTGVPITDVLGSGEIIGSLCHFDVVEREIDPHEFELLQRAARVINPNLIRI